MSSEGNGVLPAAGGFVLLAGICILGFWGCPQYEVYSKRMSGQAQLAEAESNRQVTVAESRAKEEGAKYLAASDSIRAHGVAVANKIIGQSLKENEDYLTWLQIEALKETKDQVIYVPTEASLPILEGTRHLLKAQQAAEAKK